MGITATDSGGTNFDPVPQGIHQAVCYGVYDLGTQFSERFGKSNRKVLIQWELPEQRIDIEKDDKSVNLPRAISKQYTCSLHEKSNLRKDLENWRGKSFTGEELKGFDISKLLGVNCQLQVLHKKKDEKIYANVTAILPIEKGKWKTAENTLRYYSFEEEMEIPEGTPQWIEDLITASEEWGRTSDEYPRDEIPPDDYEYEPEDDIPF